MGFQIYMNDNDYPGYHVEIVVDSRDEIEEVPTTYAPGSSCLVTEDSSVWILNTQKEWIEI